MADACGDCLRRLVCEVTGASCPKLDALISNFDNSKNQKGDISMTNSSDSSPKPTAPKNSMKATELKEPETIVPAQSTGPKLELDRVIDAKNENEILFSGSPSEVASWLNERPEAVYLVRPYGSIESITSMRYLSMQKKSLIQRTKKTVKKLTDDRKFMVLLGSTLIIAGLTYKNNRRNAVSSETADDMDVTTSEDDLSDGSI